MRTVDPDVWNKKMKKRVPSSLASFFVKKFADSYAWPPSTYEKIFRKSVRDTVKEYLKHSSIAGTKIIVDQRRHLVERMFFFVLGLVGLAVVTTAATYALVLMAERPILVSLETNEYSSKEFSFPGVALCDVNLISKRAALNYTRQILESARKRNRFRLLPREEIVYEWVRRIGYMYDYQIEDYTYLASLSELLHYPEGSDEDVDYSVLKKLEPTCKDMLVRCSWRGVDVSCSDIFTRKKTSYGHCCTFNYVRKHNEHGEPIGFTREPLILPTPGIGYGLSVMVRNNIDDYAYQKQNSIGINVLIFNSLDFPDQTSGALTTHLTLANRTVYLNIRAIVQHGTWQVRRWGLDKRGCRFRSELSQFHGHYSYSECISACRLRTSYNLCHCAPFNLPSGGRKKCTFSDIPCLHKHKEKFVYMYPNRPNDIGLLEETQNSLFCPECYPDCEYIRYSVKPFITRTMEREDAIKTNFKSGIDLTNMTIIHAYYGSDDHALFKMDVAVDWFELISVLGSVWYVFAGMSMMSVMEASYFCFYRFFVVWNNNKKKYFNKNC